MAEETVTPPENFFKQVLEGYAHLNRQIDAVERAISILEEKGFAVGVGDEANSAPTVALKQTLKQLVSRRDIFDKAEVIFSVPLPPNPFTDLTVDSSTQTE